MKRHALAYVSYSNEIEYSGIISNAIKRKAKRKGGGEFRNKNRNENVNTPRQEKSKTFQDKRTYTKVNGHIKVHLVGERLGDICLLGSNNQAHGNHQGNGISCNWDQTYVKEGLHEFFGLRWVSEKAPFSEQLQPHLVTVKEEKRETGERRTKGKPRIEGEICEGKKERRED